MGGALGLVTQQEWWRPLTIAAVLSLAVVVPWWKASPGTTNLGALIVDMAVLVVLLPPWGDRVSQAL